MRNFFKKKAPDPEPVFANTLTIAISPDSLDFFVNFESFEDEDLVAFTFVLKQLCLGKASQRLADALHEGAGGCGFSPQIVKEAVEMIRGTGDDEPLFDPTDVCGNLLND